MSIRVYASAPGQPLRNFWSNIHFHPTDAIEDDWGQRYLTEVAENHAAHTVRMYAMLEDIVGEAPDGSLRFDFTDNDTRIDFLLSKGFNLLISYNFIPPCIAVDRGTAGTEIKFSTRYKGKTISTSGVRDYALWEEVCYNYTKHIIDRYGIDTVRNWYLQCFNEPELAGFFMKSLGNSPEATQKRMEEYLKLYTAFANGATRADPHVKIGGPTAAGGAMFDFFLNYASSHGLRVDFACAHAYGTSPKGLNAGNDYAVEAIVKKLTGYNATIQKYYTGGLEFVLDEWGASSGGFYDLDDCPRLILRETEQYAAYYGKLITALAGSGIPVSRMMICLSGSHQPHQSPETFREFSGFRSFFTEHFIRKPIFNAYILGARLGEVQIPVDMEDAVNNDFSVIATKRSCGSYAVLASYASPNFEVQLPEITEELSFHGIAGNFRVTTTILDEGHAAPYRLAGKNGWQFPYSNEQLVILRSESVPKPIIGTVCGCGPLKVPVTLRGAGIALVELAPV